MPELFDVGASCDQKILLTGRPGCGKTTLIKQVVNKLPQSPQSLFPGSVL
jgi:nucleoside-triphosphatase THEP1